MGEAIEDRADGIGALGRAYYRRRHTILFYSLLLTIAAGPLFASMGLGTDLIELFLAINLVAAVIPIGSHSGRRLLLGILIAALIIRLATGWLNQTTLAAAILMIWTVVALIAAGVALRFSFSARSVDRQHVDAALSAYLLAGVFLPASIGFLSRSSPALSPSPVISPPTVRSILVSSPWRRWARVISCHAPMWRGVWPLLRESADSCFWRCWLLAWSASTRGGTKPTQTNKSPNIQRGFN